MHTVFISHATQDTQFAHRLADDLRRLGVQVWIAPESIRPGEGWVSAIERGLEESSHMVVVLTPAALTSKWVKKETDVAIAQERKGHIQIIPLDVEPCKVPLLLSSYQMVSFRRDYDVGLSQLSGILGVGVAPPKLVLPTVRERLQPFEPEMTLIPAGEFLMGSDPSADRHATDAEQPQHTLYLLDYYLAKTPVTNIQYAAFVQATSYEPPGHWVSDEPPRGKEDHPVVNVSWRDAVVYCRWLSRVTGKPYRLPSEAEWEKGARGSDGRIYPWGNKWDTERCNSKEGDQRDTTPVGAYPQGASPYDLLDMAGNVCEWTRSALLDYPYDPKDGREDLEAEDPTVLRGGAFFFSLEIVRCAARYWAILSDHIDFHGFRVMLAPSSPADTIELSGPRAVQVNLTGSGAAAAGGRATSAGAGGVAVGGDVHGGIHVGGKEKGK
jgi:formylglycine-generating enzyme required for sulfatase activity